MRSDEEQIDPRSSPEIVGSYKPLSSNIIREVLEHCELGYF
jgi:hypothetical protein